MTKKVFICIKLKCSVLVIYQNLLMMIISCDLILVYYLSWHYKIINLKSKLRVKKLFKLVYRKVFLVGVSQLLCLIKQI